MFNDVYAACQQVVFTTTVVSYKMIRTYPGTWHAGRESFNSICPKEAVWTFDTDSCIWQMRPTSGDLPKPYEAHALAVVNSHAYLLTAEEVNSNGLTVHELDLETWQWRCLASPEIPYFMDSSMQASAGNDTIAAAVVKVGLRTLRATSKKYPCSTSASRSVLVTLCIL